MVYQWLLNNLSDWLPQACCLCGRDSPSMAICPACRQDLPYFDPGHSCQQCGRPLASPTGQACGHCLRKPPAYDRVIAGLAYADPAAQLVSKLKFQGQLQFARLFGELLASRVAASGSRAQAIVPVPLHPRRMRQRGFNQALEIARPLSRLLGLPILTDSLYRNRHTQPQSEQEATCRQHNVRGAFSLRHIPECSSLAIVDDVMTSGHTVNEMAVLLRRAGVQQIEIWCAARAWPHQD